MKHLICAIDLGSFITKVVIGQLSNSRLEIVGVGNALSEGIREGEIINMEHAVKTIQTAIREAETISGLQILRSVGNITGKNIKGENSTGMSVISNEDRIITQWDVDRAVDNARNIAIPSEYQILHVLSREYIVDKKSRVPDPIGMTGFRLEVDVHIVTAPSIQIKNIYKTFQKSGIEMEHLILNSLASSEAVLQDNERMGGCIVIDLGHGVSDVSIFIDGGIYHTFSIPLGAYWLTWDLHYAFKLPFNVAEFVKKNEGIAYTGDVDPTQKISLPHSSESPRKVVHLKQVAEVIQARLEEIFEIIDKMIRKKIDRNLLSGGVILTGGGALLPSIEKVAENIFNMNVRIGRPHGIFGLVHEVNSPEYSTSVGMLKFAAKQIWIDMENGMTEVPKKGKTLIHRLRNWISENI